MTAKSKEELVRILLSYHQAHGEVPGKRRFEKDTGISESQLYKHWPRWSDFVKAAGLRENSLQPKSDSETLLRHLAEATRELRKFPTSPELRILRQQNKAVPNDKTLRNHFGDNNKLRNALKEFCNMQTEFADVAQYVIENDEHEILPQVASKNLDGEVYLFLMRVGKEKRYKIGRTINSDVRFRQLSADLPENLEKVHSIKTDDVVGIEAYWHDRFQSKRKKGEWFALSPDDLRAFTKRKFQ